MLERIYPDKWTVEPHNGSVPVFRRNHETGLINRPIFDAIPAHVPGSVLRDAEAAGLIPDPLTDMNALGCEWLAAHWWMYRTAFTLPDGMDADDRVELVFEGIDYRAHIFLNGKEIGLSENMFVPFRTDVTELCLKENIIEVAIEDAPRLDGCIGRTPDSSEQKARFNYKWDFCSRLISLGIYRPAYIAIHGRASISNWYFRPQEKRAELTVSLCGGSERTVVTAHIDGMTLPLRRMKNGTYECIIEPREVKYWQPNGSGEAALYDLTINVADDGRESDALTCKVGFKNVRLVSNDNPPIGALNYLFEINGKRTYIKGVNMTPADITCVNDPDRIETLVRMAHDANINMIRIWGGGVIEDDIFYDACDRYGIMVWQDFPQSSSGIDNTTAKNEKFLTGLRKTAEYAVRTLRNRASLTIWSGGNELNGDDGRPVTFADPNIGMLLGIVTTLSPHTPMLPSTGSGPYGWGGVTKQLGMNHDVHGSYKYRGTTDHYNFYNKLDSLFHGEFSVDGMCCEQSMKKFLSAPHLRVTDTNEDVVWRFHGDLWDTSERDAEIFGKPTSLHDMITRSQFIQAEGLRYIIEADRRRAYHSSGSVIWQLGECCPCYSSTAITDYYLKPKLAYYQTAKAYSPLCVSLAYDKLVWEAGETIRVRAYVTSDFPAGSGDIICRVIYGEEMSESVVQCFDGLTVGIGEFEFTPHGDYADFTLEADNGSYKFTNKVRLLIRGKNGACSDIGLDKWVESFGTEI